MSLNVIHVCTSINHPYNKTDRCTDVKIVLLLTIDHNSDMFRSILVIFMALSNISKVYLRTQKAYQVNQNLCMKYL
jgi:hypothetical protein